ncbi:MAG: chorismate mutase, partial [Nanoarchaeota archaeon]|nr:chorismate mutase [Nanoarchaeota archaeon]
MKNKNQIKILREQIDEIDEQLFDLLDRRFGTVKKLSRIKRKIKISITDIQRQEKIIQRITQKYNKIDPKFIEEIFLSIFDYSKILQLYKIENKSLIKNLQEKPLLIAGPCSIESKEQIETISNFLKENGIKFLRGGIFKPRTSPESFQGLGIDGLIYMKDAAVKNDQYIVTEIMTEKQLDQVYDFVDVIQIGSRNMCSFGLLKAIGKKTAKDKKPILLKRGMNSTINEYLSAVKYL